MLEPSKVNVKEKKNKGFKITPIMSIDFERTDVQIF